jgi:AraC-like DNA-binding protein
MTEDDPLAGICAYLLWLGRDRPEGWERRARMALEFLLDAFVSGPLPPERNDARLGPFSAVVDLLRSEWSSMPLRRVGVEELASTAGVSRSYLERLFRAEVQLPAASRLESLRFVRVESLLVRTDMPVGAIARQCGFADLFHLSHRFKRRYGLSPSAYRAAGGLGPSVIDEPGVARLASAIWG